MNPTTAETISEAAARALGHVVPRTALERAALEVLKYALDDPKTFPDAIGWVQGVLGGTGPAMPPSVGPREASDLLAELELAEAAHRRGAADLVAAVLAWTLRVLVAGGGL